MSAAVVIYPSTIFLQILRKYQLFYDHFFFIWPLDSTNKNQAYKRTVYPLEGHKVTLISIVYFMRIIFFPRWHRDSNQREDLEAYSTYRYYYRFVQAYSTYRYYYTRFVHTIRYYAVGSQRTPSSDKSGFIQPSSAAWRSVAPCGAVRSRAVRCRVPFAAVLCRAALCVFFGTWSSTGYNTRCVCHSSSFLFFYMYLIFHGPLFFPTQSTPRTADQNVTPVTKAHSTAEHKQGNLLCTSSSWHYQIAVRTKSWASSFFPLYMFLVAFFLALRERSGRRQPPAERGSCKWYTYARSPFGRRVMQGCWFFLPPCVCPPPIGRSAWSYSAA